MKECWQEGSLRAYHDGELPLDVMQRVSSHLAECPDCEALADEIAGRASRVAALIGALPEPGQVIWMPRMASAPVRVSVRSRWAAAAIALAAGLALGFWLVPNRSEQQPAPVAKMDVEPVAPVEVPAVQPAQSVQAMQAVRIPGPRRAVRRSLPKQVFFALDDEPIETGVVVRVALGPAEIPADVVYSPDGRARAIRLVSNQSKY